MTARRILFTTLAMAAMAVPGAALAQGYGGPHGMGGPDSFDGPGLHRFEEMLPELAVVLDLSDEQQAQIEAILDEELPAIETMRDQLRDAHQAFRANHQPGTYDEAAVRAFAQSQSQTHVELMVAGARTMSRIHNVLTTEQQQRLEELRSLRPDRGRRGGPPAGRGRFSN
jgi:Spy/CpxP family protein refolding chaperone